MVVRRSLLVPGAHVGVDEALLAVDVVDGLDVLVVEVHVEAQPVVPDVVSVGLLPSKNNLDLTNQGRT